MTREDRNTMIRAMLDQGAIADSELPARYDRVVSLVVAVGNELGFEEDTLLDWRVFVCFLEGGDPGDNYRSEVDAVMQRVAKSGKEAMDVHEACLHYDHLTFDDQMLPKEAIEKMHQTEVVPFRDEIVAALARVGPLITPMREVVD
ncbi:hypothetical protein QPK87_19515 [Kamptonema cortianum]|nr:hypothetical protein [Kamptonema cortianum]